MLEDIVQFVSLNLPNSSSKSSYSAACAAAILFLGVLVRWFARPSIKPLNLPSFAVGSDVVATIEEAHRQYPTEPFELTMPGMSLAILPTSEIETIKALPETTVSIKKHHHDVFLGEYTYMGTKADEFDSTMRNVLTRNTPAVLASFVAEVEYAVTQNIGPCPEWTAVKPRHAMSRIASLMSSRAFVGLPLSRDEAWVEATVNYTGDVSKAWLVLRLLPWFIRPIVAPFLPQVQSLKAQRAINVQKLAPLLAAKKAESSENNKKKTTTTTTTAKSAIPGGDLIDWFISQYSSPPTATQLGRDQLLATFASIYNLSNALTYLLFDLAACPATTIAELRAEVEQHVNDPSGKIDKHSLVKLRKLDSFVKESQRLSPPSLVNIPRIVTNPAGLKLSTGHTIPYGNRTMVLSHTINRDPKLYPDPHTFDPFRFSRLRDQPGKEQKFQHATTGFDNINFGHGLWACPGRFFASAEIKVVLAWLVTHYDVKLRDGEEKPKQQHWGLAILPNPTAEVLVKARSK